MNGWEQRLSDLCKEYEPESLLVRSGLWSARWMHAPATAAACLQLWYIDRGAQFERLVQSTIPYGSRVWLPHLFNAQMQANEALIESEFTA